MSNIQLPPGHPPLENTPLKNATLAGITKFPAGAQIQVGDKKAGTPATQGYVLSQIKELVANAPETLNSLKELSDSLGNVVDFKGYLDTALAGKATVNGDGVLTSGNKTLTLGGNLTHSGAFTQTFIATGNTTVTLPTSGTLATLAKTEELTNKTLTAPVIKNSLGATVLLPGSASADSVDSRTLATLAGSETLASKTLTAPVIKNSLGATVLLPGSASVDSTQARTLATLAGTEELTSKTLTMPVIKNSLGATVLLPGSASVDSTQARTLATLAGAETLAGKTLTTPKIVNGDFIADGDGKELIVFGQTANAVNEIKISNAAAGVGPKIEATGSSDANIDLNIVTKGTSSKVNIEKGLSVGGATTLNENVSVVTGKTLTVGGATTLNGDVSVAAGKTLTVAGTTTLNGVLNADGGIACDGNKFTVADANGNTSIGGTLAVSGATTLNGNVNVGGSLTVGGSSLSFTTLTAGAPLVMGNYIVGAVGLTLILPFPTTIGTLAIIYSPIYGYTLNYAAHNGQTGSNTGIPAGSVVVSIAVSSTEWVSYRGGVPIIW